MSILENFRDQISNLAAKFVKTEETTKVFEQILQNYAVIKAVPGTAEYPAFLIVTEKTHPNAVTTPGSPFTFVDFDKDDARFSPVGAGRAVAQNDPNSPIYQFKDSKLPSKPEFGEIGSTSPSPYIGDMAREYNNELIGLSGLEKYQKMRFSDGVISGQLLLIKTPVNSARWFVRPASDKKKDKKIADFVWKALTEYQSITWTQIKQEAMLSCDFGYAMMEKVWENRVINGKEYTVLKKLAPRNPMDVKEWKFDENGGPEAVVMYQRLGTGSNSYSVVEKTININKLIVFTYQKEFGNITGRSVMRPMYKHSYFKDQLYKIDAIQKERHGIGIPVIKLPVNATKADAEEAEKLGRNLRTNERANVVMPWGWDMLFAQLQGQPVDALKSVEVHDKAIRESVLGGFSGSDSVTKEEDLSLFLKATRSLAESICDAINLYLIPELVRYNFDNVTDLPKLTARQIGEQGDLRVMSFALRNVIGAGVIRPDDVLEAHVRELMDLPLADLETVRVVKAPGAGEQPKGPLPNATPGQPGQPGQPGPGDPNAKPSQPSQPGNTNLMPKAGQNGVGLPRQTALPAVGVGGKGIGTDKGQS